MAWFRPMGADEVAYHEATVVGRADDHPGAALDYYGGRGETPLPWGGAGAARMGLIGEVTPEAYEATFGPGGSRDPVTGEQLVSTKRLGFELVVSAYKSVAVLGVIDRADDMHSILDVETDATMDWLDGWLQERGGGRALEDAGYRVVGTSTSGQAARTLGTEAHIESRTTTSLLWRLDHDLIALDDRSVVIIDEAAMTADRVAEARWQAVGQPAADDLQHAITKMEEDIERSDVAQCRQYLASLVDSRTRSAISRDAPITGYEELGL